MSLPELPEGLKLDLSDTVLPDLQDIDESEDYYKQAVTTNYQTLDDSLLSDSNNFSNEDIDEPLDFFNDEQTPSSSIEESRENPVEDWSWEDTSTEGPKQPYDGWSWRDDETESAPSSEIPHPAQELEELGIDELLSDLADIPEEDEEWSWEEVDDTENEDLGDETPTNTSFEFEPEEVHQLEEFPEFDAPDKETVDYESQEGVPLEEFPENQLEGTPEKQSLWSRIKADFGGESEEDDGSNENKDKRTNEDSPEKKSASLFKKIFHLVAMPYKYVAKLILSALTGILNIFAKIPLVGQLFAKILRASKVLNLVSMVLPGVITAYALTGIILSSAPGSTTIQLPDMGEATFTNFKARNGKVQGVIENKGEVIAYVDPIFKVYSYSPIFSKPGSWFKLEEVAECRGEPVVVDIDGSVEVSVSCPEFDGGLFTKVSGDLVE